MLSCLAGSEHETNARKALTLLDQWDVVKPQDQLSLFIGLYRNPTARERTFEWLRTHWDDVAKVMGDKSLDSYPRYLAGMMKTHAELDQFKDFFWPMHSDPALSRAIEIGLRQIESRLALIESDRRAVEDWLREHE